jgi:hypothetical protein
LAFSTRPPCPSIDFVCDDDAGLRGTSRSRAPWGRVDQTARPSWPSLLLRRLNPACAVRRPWCARRLASRPDVSRPCGLRTPLMGLSNIAPPSTWAPGVLSRCFRCSEELPPCVFPKESAWRRGATFGPGLPRPEHVPSLPFFPTSTVCSTWHFAGLLHPAADPGVRHVSSRSSRAAGLTSPSAEAGEGTGLRDAVRSHPRVLPCRFLPLTLPVGSLDPEGPCSLSRRGSHPFLSDLSQWRSTLRSFPLISSCAASTVRFSRAPYTPPSPGGPGRGVVSGA